LMNSFKKDTDTPIDFVDLLPFPEEVKESESRISDRTRRVIEKMMKDKQFPVPVLSALSLLLK